MCNATIDQTNFLASAVCNMLVPVLTQKVRTEDSRKKYAA